MNRIKKAITVFISCVFCLTLLAGCGSSNASENDSKNAVLSLLNNARISNNASVLVESDQADIVASRIANAAIDNWKGDITDQQFKTEFYNAGSTTINGNFCTALYADPSIPTRITDFSGQDVAYKNGRIVGVAVRRYKNFAVTVIIVY